MALQTMGGKWKNNVWTPTKKDEPIAPGTVNTEATNDAQSKLLTALNLSQTQFDTLPAPLKTELLTMRNDTAQAIDATAKMDVARTAMDDYLKSLDVKYANTGNKPSAKEQQQITSHISRWDKASKDDALAWKKAGENRERLEEIKTQIPKILNPLKQKSPKK